MNKRSLALLIIAVTVAAATGCLLAVAVLTFSSYGDFLGQAPAETPTPTKTFVPTFTSTPAVVSSPTDTPSPTSEPMSSPPPEAPTPTQPPTPTLGPPTNTPVPPPPAPTPTPRPPTPTNTPQPAYEYHYLSGPSKDPCHPGFCLPEIGGMVVDPQHNPIDYPQVWMKMESAAFGVQYCLTGDQAQRLQPGQFKFQSGGLKFGVYTLTVLESQGGRPLSATYEGKMNSLVKAGQQTNLIFQRNH